MKRRIDLVEEESKHEESKSTGDEREDEEPRIAPLFVYVRVFCLYIRVLALNKKNKKT